MYFAALRAHGTEVITLPTLEDFPDCFVEDAAVILDDVALIPNLGHPSRDGEKESVAEYLADDFDIIRMPDGATLDGGDVVFYDDRFLVGISTRTNRQGADFLAEHAKGAGIDVQLFDVPKSTLHLTTVCSSPRPGTMVAAMGHLKEDDLSFAEEVIWIPEEEGYAANTIAYGDRIIMAEGYKKQALVDGCGILYHVDRNDRVQEVDASLTCSLSSSDSLLATAGSVESCTSQQN